MAAAPAPRPPRRLLLLALLLQLRPSASSAAAAEELAAAACAARGGRGRAGGAAGLPAPEGEAERACGKNGTGRAAGGAGEGGGEGGGSSWPLVQPWLSQPPEHSVFEACCRAAAPATAVWLQCLDLALVVLCSIFMPGTVFCLVFQLCTLCAVATTRKPVVSASEIEDRFPTKQVEGMPEVADICAICLGNFQKGEGCRRLRCRHVYHAECILEWWTCAPRAVLLCPCCRQLQEGSPSPRLTARAAVPRAANPP